MVEITIDWFKRLDQWRIFVMKTETTEIITCSDTLLDEASAIDEANKLQKQYGGKIERLTING